ncbi:hypothetical protein XOC_2078 [Xanthomonas oryzae pv. oryzicola BLS256]|uniref:Uncharacterized protein n=1 Tax=Xanthomonas oryzae pv. oryzicola (strain BLS256) TaxID=383407 RepID=G7TCP6_XANOB|nr:hypothetical protein XOC_2078 [Xanthomonas oryzae pv. oryzicola BLS256]QEO97816.1 hypothetical protein XOCgx_2827 [Xanthomonas oryzae pv. oryzicola]
MRKRSNSRRERPVHAMCKPLFHNGRPRATCHNAARPFGQRVHSYSEAIPL